MVHFLWRHLRTAAWGRLCRWRCVPAAGAVLLQGVTAPFEQRQRGRGMPEEKLRFDAIIGLPDGQCWVLHYWGPSWRVAGNSGMERMTNQIASGRVLLQTLLE